MVTASAAARRTQNCAVPASYLGDMTLPVTFEDVAAAAERIAGSIVATPAVDAPAISELTGARVSLKLETRQRTGSFKDRGAANRLLQLSAAERAQGVIAMSAGNHAQAVAYQGMRLGIPTTIVMPEATPFTKVRRTKAFGARIILAGEGLAEAGVRAREIAADEGLVLVPPYEDTRIVAGQGTAGLEWLRAVPDLEVLLVPVGGGGLIAGIAIAAKHLKPSIEIVGVQTELYPSLYRVLNGLPPVTGGQTIAEGIAVKSVGEIPLQIVRELVSDVILVSEGSIERAIHLLLEEEKLLAEGAGAAPLAALLDSAERFRGRRVGVALCGGNIDTGLLANVINRVRLQEGRVVRVRVEIHDKPGVLADVARLIGECGANVLDVTHQRLFSDVPSKQAELDITLETRAPGDIGDILAKLDAAHYGTSLLETKAHASI
jgi:threonine dehydratase